MGVGKWAWVANWLWSFCCWWFVYGRDTTTIWPVESEKTWLPLRRTKWWFGFQSWFQTHCWQVPSWNPWWLPLWRRRKRTITAASWKALVRLCVNAAGFLCGGHLLSFHRQYFSLFSQKNAKNIVYLFIQLLPHTATITHVHTRTYHTSVCICAT